MFRNHLLLFLILFPAGVYAQDSVASEEPKPKKFLIQVSVGQASEDFKWSIAGNIEGTSPNIFSELIWSDLKGTPFRLDAKWNFWKAFLIRTRFSHMNITSGKVNDTDYEGENRTVPVFDVTVEAGAGSISSFTGEVGYRIINSDFLQLNGYAGYTNSQQHLFLLDPQGKFDSKLRSTYEARWQGALAALEADFRFGSVVGLAIHATYHQVSYDAVADWNLIETFQHPVSFEHTAKGFGIEGSAQLKFHINEDVGFFLDTTYSEWKTGKGTDRLHLADGTVQHTQLNEVIRESLGFNIGMLVQF